MPPVWTAAPAITFGQVGSAVTYSGGSFTASLTPTASYTIYLDGVSKGSSYTPVGGDEGKTLTVTGVATNAFGSASSTSAGYIVLAAPIVAPGQVTGLTSPSQTSAAVSLSWTAPSSGGAVADYEIQWSPAGAGTWTTISDGTSTATTATVSGLSAATSYDFRVRATNSAGNGSYSTTLTQSTSAAAGSNTMTVTWVAPASTVEGGPVDVAAYRVTWGATQGGPYPNSSGDIVSPTSATVMGVTEYSYDITGLASGTWYAVVEVKDSAGTYSNASYEVSKVVA